MARSIVLSIEGYEAFGKTTVTFRRRRNFESFPIVFRFIAPRDFFSIRILRFKGFPWVSFVAATFIPA
jgi:hypothetical protein